MLPQVNLVRANHGDFLSFFDPRGISSVLTSHGVWDEITILISKILIDNSTLQPLVLDIGANMGTFTVPIAKHIQAKSGNVISFEPQRIVFYQLCGNIFLNRLDNVFAYNKALSSSNEFQEIDELNFHTAWNIGAYSLVEDKDKQERSNKKVLCEFSTLDSLRFERTVTLLKLDVEGMELDVLKGGINLLDKSNFPPILFEAHEDEKKDNLMKFLSDLGYSISRYSDMDFLAQHSKWQSEIELIINDSGYNYRRVR